MKKLYKVGNRDIEELDTYADHVHAMTGEKLHGKSDIAAELAFRDARIAELTNENEALSEALDFEREHSESKITELEEERKPLSLAQFIYAYYMEKNSTPNDLYSWMVKWGYLNKKEKGDE